MEEYKNAEVLPKPKEFGPRAIIEEVNRHCSPDTIVATDVGQHQMWAMQFYHYEKPRVLLTSGRAGNHGLRPGSGHRRLHRLRKKTDGPFTGDGSFGMNLNEMATAVSQELPITIVIFNNDVLGMVRQWQTIFYEEHYSQTTLKPPDRFPGAGKRLRREGLFRLYVFGSGGRLKRGSKGGRPGSHRLSYR